jgi:hypothetical protein
MVNIVTEIVMRIQEILRALIDVIDSHEEMDSQDGKNMVQGMSDAEPTELSNQPNEQYADVAAITTLAGGGPNAPKHPADIRVKDPRGFE